MIRIFKKGFSLLETVVAMALIVICFMMTITSILAISNTYKNTDNLRFFTNEVSGYLECYKVDGSKNFIKNVNELLLVDLYSAEDYEENKLDEQVKSGEAVFTYTVDFEFVGCAFKVGSDSLPQKIRENAKYYLHINFGESFYAQVLDDEVKNVFKMDKAFVSRYDA